VRRLAAGIRRETEHHVPVEHSGRRRRQVVADDDARFLQFAQVGFVGAAQESVQHPGGNVPHIGGALPQILVVHPAEGGAIFFGDLLEGVFGVDFLLLDEADHFIDQRGVFQHEQVSVEDTGVLGAHRFVDLVLDLEDLLPSPRQGLFQSVNFLRYIPLRKVNPRDGLLGLAEYDDFPPANTTGHRYTPQYLLP